MIFLLVLGSPIWISLLAAVVIVLLSVYLVLWTVDVTLWVAELSLGAGALAGVLECLVGMVQANVWAGVALFGVSLFLAGLGIFGFYACLYVSKGMCSLSEKLFRFLKFRFIRKEAIQ